MAKGSFLGVKRGKLGDAVGYNVTNSNDKDKQGWRVYQPVVANPQSDAQIDQRVKLAAVNNLYRALKPIIQRGWENHEYGDPSRRAFLKKALGRTFAGPYLEKGSTLAVPIEGVPIMYGSLTPIVLVADTDEIVFANISVDVDTDDTDTVGGVSAILIRNGYQEGDQVTVVLGYVNESATVSYKTISFFVTPNDTTTFEDAFGFMFSKANYDGNNVLIINTADITFNFGAAYCALCSISRDGDGQHLRSAAEFEMSDAFRNLFYDNADANARAKASYRKTTGTSTNWEQVPGGGGYTPVVQSAFTRAGVEFTPVSIARKNVGGQNFEVIVDDGGVQYYIGSRPSAASSEIVYLSGTGSTASVDPSDLSTANSVNVFDSANTAAGLRAWLISKGIDATVLPV